MSPFCNRYVVSPAQRRLRALSERSSAPSLNSWQHLFAKPTKRTGGGGATRGGDEEGGDEEGSGEDEDKYRAGAGLSVASAAFDMLFQLSRPQLGLLAYFAFLQVARHGGVTMVSYEAVRRNGMERGDSLSRPIGRAMMSS